MNRRLGRLDRTFLLASAGSIGAIALCAKKICLTAASSAGTTEGFPSPYGIFCLLASTAISQVVLISWYARRRLSNFEVSTSRSIQVKAVTYGSSFKEELFKHVNRPEVSVLAVFLVATWMLKLMPQSYYDTEAPVSFIDVLKQLLLVDYFTFSFHVVLHNFPKMYIRCHKPHHKFTSPQLFNTFDSSVYDTLFLILIPV